MARPWYQRRWLLTLIGAAVVVGISQGVDSAPDDRPAAGTSAAHSSAVASGTPHATEPTAAATRKPTQTPRSQPSRSQPPRPAPATHSRPPAGTALQLLATLPVKGRAPKTGYDRDQFGQAWLDTDRNGCDTRDDILRRDLTGVQIDPATHGCLVVAGTLDDPYTGQQLSYVRGHSVVDIDHVVALSDAWQKGAFAWDVRKRAALANDPMNLLAVDMSANRQKGDGDAATWLPSNKAFRCAYVARQVSVKAKYHLWVTPAERDAVRRILDSCPGQRGWTGGAPTISPVAVNVPVRPSTPRPTESAGGSGDSGDVYYANCDAVRAAGAAPIHAGEPGYAPHLDRDGDGVGCE